MAIHDASIKAADYEGAAELLGGARLLKHRLDTPLDAHELVLQGIPRASLKHLMERLVLLDSTTSLERAVGMSVRTFQRRGSAPEKPLNQEQSGRTLKFAEILTKATKILGSQNEAEQWLVQPAFGLEQRRPIDLLATSAGVELVEDYLVRIEHGVYA